MALLVIGGLIGFMGGLRFKFLILIPTIVLAAIIIGVAGTASQQYTWSIVRAMLVMSVVLQFGYLIGMLAKHFAAS